jgi:hypothetical protein
MNSGSYLAYALLVIGGWTILIVVVWLLTKGKPKGALPAIILGPAYFVLKRQDWNISRREVVLWAFVALLMLVAPLISYWLEN